MGQRQKTNISKMNPTDFFILQEGESERIETLDETIVNTTSTGCRYPVKIERTTKSESPSERT